MDLMIKVKLIIDLKILKSTLQRKCKILFKLKIFDNKIKLFKVKNWLIAEFMFVYILLIDKIYQIKN
jgi:hypothetical protein